MIRIPFIEKRSQQQTTFHNDKATIHWSNKSQQQTTFHNDMATIHWSNKSQQRTLFHNDKATIHWSDKNIDNIVPSIMTTLPFM